MKMLITVIVGVLLTSKIMAQGLPGQEHIIISGSGYVERMPDFAEINLSVNKTSETLKSSKDYVDIITQQVLDAAVATGVAPEDIGASKIHAQPSYKWVKDERKYLGERVSRSVTLVLRDLTQYSVLVQAVIDAGITELDGVQLRFNDRNAIEREAMKLAIDDARKKAEVIAQQFSSKVGSVYKISETAIDDGTYYRSQHYAMMADVGQSGRRAALKIRKQRVDESVFVVFLLRP
ncbi:SIMPL domain-containing protein [Oceanicoccus sp. KOV_DT_Chl]|uniref:SIMPL domain-containing protein n=1 Tax=Oceanicoccus sp. KOV_DT_Chl TaxID=1904639 RepID=UPI000C7BD978|nr:SIMPL domain-containing protein [Oceanicoccus sp. KOV_DT_Chl]